MYRSTLANTEPLFEGARSTYELGTVIDANCLLVTLTNKIPLLLLKIGLTN